MQVFLFNIANSRLRRYSSGVITEGSYGKTVFKFNFNTHDWDSVTTKIATFSYHGENYPKPLDKNNMCIVPEEVLHKGAFKVSVSGDGILTNNVRVPVEEKEVSNPSTYDEIIKLIETHTHEQYIEEQEIEEIIPDVFDAGKIIEP